MFKGNRQTVRAGKPVFVDGPQIPDREPKPAATYDYCYEGSVLEYEGERDNSLARREVYSDTSEKFYIKVWTAGIARNKVLDPWGINYNVGDERRATVAGMKRHEFRAVSPEKFKLYLEYLNTRKAALIKAVNNL